MVDLARGAAWIGRLAVRRANRAESLRGQQLIAASSGAPPTRLMVARSVAVEER